MSDKRPNVRETKPGEHPINVESFNDIQKALNFMDDLLQDRRDFAVNCDKFGGITVAYPGPRPA